MSHRIVLILLLAAGVPLITSCDEFANSSLGPTGPAAIVRVSSENVTGRAGEPLAQPLRVRVTDNAGNGVAGVSVEWSATGGTLGSTSSTTNADGVAEMGWTMGSTLGQISAEASATNLTPMSFTATVQAGRPAVLTLSHQDLGFDAIGQSQQVDPTLIEDRFGNDASGASVAWTSDNTAVATVTSSGVIEAAGDGTATVTATADTATATVQVTVDQVVTSVTVAPETETIAVGGTMSLDEAALDANGHEVPDATFTFTSFNTAVATVDNSGIVTGVAEGTATIRATSAGFFDEVTMTVVEAVDPGDCPIVGSVAVGESVDGVLETGDCSPDGVSFVDVWSLDLTQETTVQIDMTAPDIDTHLILMDGAGTVIEESASGAGGSDARIERTLASGSYRIGATAVAGHAGAYTLSVVEPSTGTGCDPRGPLTMGQAVDGTIDTSDCDHEPYSYYEIWQVELTEDTVAVFDLTSPDFNTYIVVTDVDGGFIGDAHDFEGTTNSHIELQLLAGTYFVHAVDVSGEGGVFSLGLSGGTTPECTTTGSIVVPDTVAGVFDGADCLLSWGSRADYWTLDVTADADIQIDLSSLDVDAYLGLFDADGNLIDADDDTGGGERGTDSRLTVSLTAGQYTILATTYYGGERGDYTLSAVEVSASASGVAGAAEPPTDKSPGMPGVFGERDRPLVLPSGLSTPRP